MSERRERDLVIDLTQRAVVHYYGEERRSQGKPDRDRLHYKIANEIIGLRQGLIGPVGRLRLAVDAGRSWRYGIFPDYKSGRAEKSEMLQNLLEPETLWEISDFALEDLDDNVQDAFCSTDGLEADDLIADVAAESSKEGRNLLIVTSDKDLFQLLSKDRVSIVRTIFQLPGNGKPLRDCVEFFTADSLMAKHGVPPWRWLDYLCLVGDSSDKIPGLAGVGPVAAKKWIETYGTIEEMCQNQDRAKGFEAQLPMLRALYGIGTEHAAKVLGIQLS